MKNTDHNPRGFTLIELLVVISIIGVLAAFTFPVMKKLKEGQYKRVARAELELIQTAIENYKARYGTYPPGNALGNPLLTDLYYELSGTQLRGAQYVTLDGGSMMNVSDVPTAYGVGGFVNCTKGTGEDASKAKNFLVNISPRQYNTDITNNNVRTSELVTSVGGPDDSYRPLGGVDVNPFRYMCPGTNNPGSYDLWIDLCINGRTNRISNWSREVQIVP